MTPWKLLGIVLLVAANAFFVAAEFGLVAVRRSRVQELVDQGSRRAASALKAIGEINLMLSGCQLGITFASLGLGAIGEPALAHLFERYFEFLPAPVDAFATHGVAVAIAFTVITFLHVVLGELVPKNLSIARPEATALWVAGPMRGFAFVFRPLIWLFNETANVVLRLFKIETRSEISEMHSPEELAIIIEESRRGGALPTGQSRILTKTLGFPDKRVIEAMIPRVATETVPSDARGEDVLQKAERTGYSRFPVWKERQDEFVGVVHLKDMLRESRKNPEATVKDAMREAVIVPESVSLEEVLVRMRAERNHFAIVLDEFGSTAGILTLEDILEELIGEIRDEYDVREIQVRKVEGGLRVPGTIRPDEMFEATGVKLPDGDYETVAGFILERLGRMAQRGDEIELEGAVIRVAHVQHRRIISVDIKPGAVVPAGETETD